MNMLADRAPLLTTPAQARISKTIFEANPDGEFIQFAVANTPEARRLHQILKSIFKNGNWFFGHIDPPKKAIIDKEDMAEIAEYTTGLTFIVNSLPSRELELIVDAIRSTGIDVDVQADKSKNGINLVIGVKPLKQPLPGALRCPS